MGELKPQKMGKNQRATIIATLFGKGKISEMEKDRQIKILLEQDD